MKLSAEQLADLAASFQPGTPRTRRQERRRTQRLALEAGLPVRLLRDDRLARPMSVRVTDFSARGLAIEFPWRLAPGSQFVVQLARQSGGCAVMLCTVMHCREQRDETFLIGAEFTFQLGEHPEKHPPLEAVDAQFQRLRESKAR